MATSDFSGLASSVWALARALAMAPIDSLDRCIADLHFEEIEADGAGFRTLGAEPMPSRLLGVLRHQAFQFGLGVLVLQEGRPGLAKDGGEFRPGIGRTHVDDADGLDAGPRRVGAEQPRGLTALNAAPELLLSREQEVLVETITGRAGPRKAPAGVGRYRSSVASFTKYFQGDSSASATEFSARVRALSPIAPPVSIVRYQTNTQYRPANELKRSSTESIYTRFGSLRGIDQRRNHSCIAGWPQQSSTPRLHRPRS
jgi:hypothetical protein